MGKMNCMWLSVALLLAAASPQAFAAKVKRGDVPKAVLDSLASRYPKAKVRNYLREEENGQTRFELETREGTVKRDILFSPDGTMLEIEEGVRPDALPELVKQSLRTLAPKARIQAAEKVTRGAETEYEVTLKEGKKTFEKVLGPDGRERSTAK